MQKISVVILFVFCLFVCLNSDQKEQLGSGLFFNVIHLGNIAALVLSLVLLKVSLTKEVSQLKKIFICLNNP